MDTFVKAAIDFVTAHRDWAGPIAFLFALVETLPILSILIPSTAILIGVGAVVATGALDFLPIWIGGSLGAILGSVTSYWIGWRYGRRLLRSWPLNKEPELARKGASAFARYGVATILIGHFVGPLRAVVFLMAGMSRMSLPLFLAVDLLGAVAWAWAVPKSGQWGGNLLGHLWALIAGA